MCTTYKESVYICNNKTSTKVQTNLEYTITQTS